MPNIKIRSMNGRFSTVGLFLEGNDFCAPKLRPGEVVEVPEDHAVFTSPAARHIEVTNEAATRPYRFGSLSDAMGQNMSPEKALESAAMIGTSLEMSARIRQDNFNALQKAKADGVHVPQEPLYRDDVDMRTVQADNALVRGQETEDTAPAVAAPPPSGRSRRGRKT